MHNETKFDAAALKGKGQMDKVDIFVIRAQTPGIERTAVGDVITDYMKDQRLKSCMGCGSTLDTGNPPFAFVVAHWPDSPVDGDTSVEALCEECGCQDDAVDVVNRHLEKQDRAYRGLRSIKSTNECLIGSTIR